MSTPSGELKAALVRNDSLPKHDARAAALAKGPGGLTVNEIDPEQELATRIYSLRKQRHQDLGESMSEAEAAKQIFADGSHGFLRAGGVLVIAHDRGAFAMPGV